VCSRWRMMEERYHATTQNRFYPDMSNVNKNIIVEAKLIGPPTYLLISMLLHSLVSYVRRLWFSKETKTSRLTRELSFCFLSYECLIALCITFSLICQINLTQFGIMPYVFSIKLMKSILKINKTGIKEIQYKCWYKFTLKKKLLKFND